MRLHNTRTPPADRSPQTPTAPTAQTMTFPAPVAGKVTNQNLANQPTNHALVMRNFWPTRRGFEPRGGYRQSVNVGATVKTLFSHAQGGLEWLFAATENKIFEIDPVTDTFTEVVTGQTDGNYSTGYVVTDDLTFLMVVNGHDPAQVFDGTSWTQIATEYSVATPYFITGVDSSNISHLWNYRNRQFMIERGTMDAYYLPVNNVFGAAERLPLGAIFNKGGSLLTGTTFSSDSGEGIDDRCVFVTDQGEVAVFQGADPSTITSWSLVGVFDLGVPLGRNMFFSAGGDPIFATKRGLVALTAAVEKTADQLELGALSENIEPDWQKQAAAAGSVDGWHMVNWRSKNMLVVTPPADTGTEQEILVCNTQTRAWTDFTGWNATAVCIYEDNLYIANGDGMVAEADVSGRDGENPFVCQVGWAFSDMGIPGIKQTSLGRAFFKHRGAFLAEISAAKDYRMAFPPPKEGLSSEQLGALWDVAVWDISGWGVDVQTDSISMLWQALFTHGVSVAPQIQIASDSDVKMNLELIKFEVVFEGGGGVV